MAFYLINSIVLFYGLCIGSFLNVCIYRVPLSKSIVSPPSACPSCGTRVAFYDNIPVLSYLILRGRCRHCPSTISPIYPAIELLTGISALMIYLRTGFTAVSLIHFIFVSALIVISFIDLEHRVIPDVISLPGIVFFLLASLFIPGSEPVQALIRSLTGIAAGGGSLFAVAYGYRLIANRDGMGGGDIKLLAMIGALVGWKGVLFTIFISSAMGTIAGLLAMIITRSNMKLAIPFGPFLSGAAVLYIFCGDLIIGWYLNTMGLHL